MCHSGHSLAFGLLCLFRTCLWRTSWYSLKYVYAREAYSFIFQLFFFFFVHRIL